MASATLQKPIQPSAELAAVIGPGPHTRAVALLIKEAEKTSRCPDCASLGTRPNR